MSPKDSNTDDMNKHLEQQAKAALDNELNSVPADIQAQLRLARMKAVAHAGKQQPTPAQPLFSKPMLALAASAVLALPLMWFMADSQKDLSGTTLVDQSVAPGDVQMDAVDSGEIMLELAQLSDEDMAIVDDLEFIAWLSEQDIEEEQRS